MDLVEINGKMSLADKVQIIDISRGGVSLKADRRLNIGKEYVIKLQEKGKTIEVKGTVVRSELSGIEQREGGQGVSIFTVGMMFKEGLADQLAAFLKPIEQTKEQMEVSPVADRRLDVRFNIMTPEDRILSYPLQFKVKTMGLGGMLMQTDETLAIDSEIPMELALDADNSVVFIGRVASCSPTENTDQTSYDIGVEFTSLADKDRELLKTFVDYLAEMAGKNNE